MKNERSLSSMQLKKDIKNSFNPEHYDDLKKSGLSDDTIINAGIETVPPHRINEEIGYNHPDISSIYKIPYPGTDFSRYKVFYSEDFKGKKPKYLQRKNSNNHLYIPENARTILQDTQIPLYFSEGEKKALKACQEGLNCVGMGGIWNFAVKDGNGKPQLIDAFNSIEWIDRKVEFVPDADFQIKPEVKHAVYRLGTMLEQRGASFSVVCLPISESVGKLDDYLCEHSIEEFNNLKRVQLKHKLFSEVKKWEGKKAGKQPEKQPEKKEENVKKELSEEEKQEALSLLNDDSLLDKFLEISEQLGCVGEDNNKVTLYLTLTSRKLDDPLSAIVKGESSSGKSYLVGSVAQFFPKEDVLQFTAITPKALYHRKDSLAHKALIIFERQGAEDADYSIRTLQSEKTLIFSTSVKDNETGKFTTIDIELKGPIAYLETTTKTHLHAENETRCFDIFVDESEKQTRKIYEAQNRRDEIMALDRQAILTPWINAQRLLKTYPVYIPYIRLIKFPTKPLRVRRDRPKFIFLIEALALLFQHKREKDVRNGKEFIVADIGDYTIAYTLISEMLEPVLKGLSPKIKELIEIAKGFDDEEFERKDVRKRVKWNRKTMEALINDAVDWGYFEITEEGGKGKPYKYKLIKTEETPIGLVTPEDLKEQMTSLASNAQLGDGHFKLAPILDKAPNAQYVQQNIERVDI